MARMPRQVCTAGHRGFAQLGRNREPEMHSDERMNTAMAFSGAFAACALVVAGCSSDPGSTGSPGSSDSTESQGLQAGDMHLISQEIGHPGGDCDDAGGAADAADAGGQSDFTSCQVDDDCVAVPLGGCCNNGWKFAVNRDDVDAYDDATACHQPRPICPMYIVHDTRVAECSHTTSQCEMVQIDDIACGGFVAHPHSCPEGYACVFGRIPDVAGHCVALSP
jgi:hypothetical protein